MIRSLYPHQEQALAYCRKVQHPALFLKMRLGKTLVSIRRIKELTKGRDWKTLVVAPKTVLDAWETELASEGLRYGLLLGSQVGRLAVLTQQLEAGVRIFLINYEGIRACPWLDEFVWQIIVLDESTAIKNPQASLTRTMLHKFGHTQHWFRLSGNPSPEGPEDYFCQMAVAEKSFMGCKNFWEFRNKYFRPVGYEWHMKPGMFDLMWKVLREKCFFMTSKQAGMFTEKVYETRYVELCPELRKAYNQLERDFSTTLGEEEIETSWSMVKAVKLARLAGGYLPQYDHKQKELRSLLLGELREEQVVVWYRFNSEILQCADYLDGISCGCLVGATPYEERRRILDDFRSGKFRVLLCQLKLGKYGLDLSNASTAIFFSNDYSSETRTQAEERTVHPSKKEPSLVIDIVASGTVDVDCLEALKEKDACSRAFFSRMQDSFIRRQR